MAIDFQHVSGGGRTVDDRVAAIATREAIGIRAALALKRIVAEAAFEHVRGGIACNDVVAERSGLGDQISIGPDCSIGETDLFNTPAS